VINYRRRGITVLTLLDVVFTAPKYRTMASSGSGEGGVGGGGGHGELVFAKGDKSKSRGLRQPNTLSVETYDLEDPELAIAAAAGVGTSSSISVGSSKDDADAKKIAYLSGNPFVEITKGVLHLYKEK
jgi:hypothetical protein